MKNDSQIHLVKKAKKGDAEAFVKLCEAYQDILYNSAYKLLQNDEDVSDCLQETELHAWRKIHTLRKDAYFYTWLFKIMTNTAKGILKRRVDTLQLEENYSPVAEKNDSHFELEELFYHLPEKYKLPLILHYYSGFNVNEIAEQLDIPSSTVKTRLARGRKKLKMLWEEN